MMNRRDALIATAGGVAAFSLSALAQGKAAPAAPAAAKDAKDAKDAKPAEPVINTALLAAAEDCMRAGEACLNNCIKILSTGDKSMAECCATVRAMLPMCTTMAAFARQASPHLKALAAVCAKVCRDCEATCKKHASHHAECKACMESCQKCAAECEKAAA